MAQGFLTSAILRAAVELGIFERLASGEAAPQALAASIGADVRGTGILLDSLVALRLLERDGAGYRLGPPADAHLVPGRPGSLDRAVHFYANDVLWEAARRLPEAVIRGGSVLDGDAATPDHRYWDELAAAVSPFLGPPAKALAELLVPWTEGRPALDILDAGCGDGTYGYAIAARNVGSRVWSLDWPNVLEHARRNVRRLGLDGRVTFIGGDMFSVPLGGPYDLAILSHVLHHFSADRCVELLRRVAGAMRPGGRLVVQDFARADAETPAVDPTPYVFSVLMLIWTKQGETHPLSAYGEMLAASGFGAPEVRDVPGQPTRFLLADRLAR